MNNIIETDVSIIGAGPVGIFASFACGMLGLKTHIFENRDCAGGQCTALYPDKFIYDIPGIPAITSQNFIDKLIIQANHFNPIFHFNAGISSWTHTSEHITINNIQSKAVIIAGGFGACIPNKLPLPNAHFYENKHLFYNVNNDKYFVNKTVIVLGGGNSAADWTLHLCKIAKKVIIIHRRDVFTAFQSTIDQFSKYVAAGKLVIYNNSIVLGIKGNDSEQNTKLYGLEIQQKDCIAQLLDTDCILACYGIRSDLSLLSNLGLHMNKDKIIVDAVTARTNLSNVYAVGDIADSATKQKLFSILSGFHECTLATTDIAKQLALNISNTHSSDMNWNGK